MWNYGGNPILIETSLNTEKYEIPMDQVLISSYTRSCIITTINTKSWQKSPPYEIMVEQISILIR